MEISEMEQQEVILQVTILGLEISRLDLIKQCNFPLGFDRVRIGNKICNEAQTIKKKKKG
jgi:hypothetical protein